MLSFAGDCPALLAIAEDLATAWRGEPRATRRRRPDFTAVLKTLGQMRRVAARNAAGRAAASTATQEVSP